MASASARNLSNLEGPLRLDGEFYRPMYVDAINAIKAWPTRSLDSLSQSILSYGAYSLTNLIEWLPTGVPYLKAENIAEGYIDYSGVLFIGENVHGALPKSQIREGQVLLAMSGTTGNAAVAHDVPGMMNSNQDVAKISLKAGYSAYYVACFLNSRYGRLQTEREIVGSVQQHVFLNQIERLLVPFLPDEIHDRIAAVYREGLDGLARAEGLYSQAERTLLEQVGMPVIDGNYGKSSRAMLSQVMSRRRLDAQHFEAASGSLVASLAKKGALRIGGIAEFNRRGVQPIYVDGGEVPVVTSKRLGPKFIDYRHLERVSQLSWDATEEARVRQYDILTYTTGAYVGRTNCYMEDLHALASNHVNILRIRGIDAIYASVFLNSLLGQMQVRRLTTGSAQAELYPSHVDDILIWDAPGEVQERIASAVLEAHGERQKALRLIAQAIDLVDLSVARPQPG